ncbi:MAG: hypothetical protein ACK2UY_02905 [Anaerolineae bacterium]|jgi:hypothetical protein
MTDADMIDTVETPIQQPEEEVPLSAEEIKLVVKGTQALQQALGEDPSLMTQLEIVVREHTHNPLTGTTMRVLYEGLRLFLGEEALDYLLGILINSDDARYVEQAEIQATPQTWTWLRRLIALYGSKIQEANAIFNANPNAWRVVNRRAFFDAVTHTWGVSLEIEKYNGDRLILEEIPGSALLLAEAIVDTLNNIPSEVAPELLTREEVERFMEKCVGLSELFAPGMLSDWAEDDEDWEEEDLEYN